MNRRSFLFRTMVFSGLNGMFNLFELYHQKVLPKVLILGDSISIGYTPYVQDMLKEIAEVHRPTLEDGTPENCEGTTKGILELITARGYPRPSAKKSFAAFIGWRQVAPHRAAVWACPSSRPLPSCTAQQSKLRITGLACASRCVFQPRLSAL
jgi:hypothetical protein